MIYERHILVNFEFVQTIQDIGCILNFFYFLNDLQIVKFEFEQTVQDVRKDLDVQYILCSWQNILKPFNPMGSKYKITIRTIIRTQTHEGWAHNYIIWVVDIDQAYTVDI